MSALPPIADINLHELACLLSANMAKLYRRKVAALTTLLQDLETKVEAFEVIRSMIEEVRLALERGKLSIDLAGQLAGILSLCQKSKKPGHDGQAHAEQITMVAGAGFVQEPTIRRAV